MKSWVGQALSCRFVLELIDFRFKNDAQETCMRVNFVLFKGFRLIEFEKVQRWKPSWQYCTRVVSVLVRIPRFVNRCL